MFMDSLKETLDNTSVTENGMIWYKSTDNALLDFLFKISSFRDYWYSQMMEVFDTFKDNEYASRLLFYCRDVRGGLGERKLFRDYLMYRRDDTIAKMTEEEFTKLCNVIVKYGRYDDLFCLIHTDLQYDHINEFLISYINDQLLKDLKACDEYWYSNISLLAKWLPSENASSKQTKDLAHFIRKGLKKSSRQYRRMLSKLRSALNIVETDMCANRWKIINYNFVPSKANLNYSEAFLRHDEERRRQYLSDVSKGAANVKINASTLYPHEIVSRYYDKNVYSHRVNYFDETLEQLWNNLPKIDGLDNTLVVRDGSGSMLTYAAGTKTCAIDIATALAIYCSQYCNSEYKDQIITFSSRPQYIDLSNKKALKDKLDFCDLYDDCSNTDLGKVFSLILDTAIKNKLSQEDLPKQLLIISDMEFDQGCDFTGNVIEEAQKQFDVYDYKVPRLIFWNVCSRTNTIPVKENELGVSLISGFSQNVLKMVMNEELDPYKSLIKELDRYTDVPLF